MSEYFSQLSWKFLVPAEGTLYFSKDLLMRAFVPKIELHYLREARLRIKQFSGLSAILVQAEVSCPSEIIYHYPESLS